MVHVDDPNYHRYHVKVYRLRGKASSQKCVDCGKQAREWSSVHDTDGSDPYSHFQPRCSRCHKRYDNIPQRTSERQRGKGLPPGASEKGAAANRGRVKSPEEIEKIRKSKVGKPRSEETRRKISETRQARGIKPTAETVEKAKQANRGKPRSEETKAKIAASRRAWWAKKKEGDT